MPKVSLGGWIINYEIDGDGPTVLAIHGGFGGFGPAVAPTDYFTPLSGVGRLITYSRRNCGKSEFRDARYTQDDLADEAAALLDHLGLAQAIIVGDSMGGTIAQSFALRHPGKVRALVLSETSAHMRDAMFYGPLHRMCQIDAEQGPEAVFERQRGNMENPPAPQFNELTPEFRKVQMLEQWERVKAAAAAGVDESLMRRIGLGELRNWQAHAEFDTRDQLHDLGRHKVLVLHGDADPVVPTEHGLELAHGIPGAELKLIPGGQHAIINWPEAVSALKEWIAAV
jgi:3-oxoadipate enol-lactonase